jgi:CBS domain-containing protein
MRIFDVMTPQVETVSSRSSIREAAERMNSLDVGFMPVQEDDCVVGILTDRDIAVRAVAQGVDADMTAVTEIMTTEMWCLPADRDVQEAAQLMADKQIRRLLVLDDDNRLIGVVSLGDIAVQSHDAALSGKVLERVSEPADPARPTHVCQTVSGRAHV